MIKTKFRSLHSFIAGSLLLAISPASAQTLPDPLTGSVVLDVSGGPVTYGGNRSVSGATLSFTSEGSGTRTAILPGSLTGTGSLTFVDPGTLSLTGSSSYSGGTIVRDGTFSVGSTGTLGVNDTTTRRLTVTGDGNPLFPALRSGPMALSGASRTKQIHSSVNSFKKAEKFVD